MLFLSYRHVPYNSAKVLSVLRIVFPDCQIIMCQISKYISEIDLDYSFLLEGETPRLIDEWQAVPLFWYAIRFEVDHRDEDGQFTVLAEAKDIHHTGTGRYGWLTMRPMSLWESGDSTLSDLFLTPDKKIGALNKLTLSMLAFIVCRGGWPKALQKKQKRLHCCRRQNIITPLQIAIYRMLIIGIGLYAAEAC